MRLELIMFIEENSKPNEKLKAWYLFTEDFVAGTSHLTNEEVGIYIRLLLVGTGISVVLAYQKTK